MVDTSESQQYINRKTGVRDLTKTASKAEDGTSYAMMAHHVASHEGGAREPYGDGPNGGSPSLRKKGISNLSKAVRIARDANDDDAFFGPERYQDFSREPIVFYKRVVNDQKMLKWTVKAGSAFKRATTGGSGSKFFLPITLLGQVLGSHQLVSYKMNLELIKVPEAGARALDAYKFESIWPFILYLFNYWVKNQASLMLESQSHAQRQIYQAELRRISRSRNYIEFFHETPKLLEQIEEREQAAALEVPVDPGTPRQGRTPVPAKKNLTQEPPGFMTQGRKARKQYDNFMDFSSEIEYDERFEADEFMAANRAVGTLAEGQPRIDRTLPAHARPNTKVQRQKNREKLFEAYKQTIEEAELAKRKVTFDAGVDAEEETKDAERAARERAREAQLRE